MLLEKKRTVAEEEAAYLRSLIDTGKTNSSVIHSERVRELENQLQEILKDYTTLQSKVSQWARNSKRHQEGRIAAEASQRVLEEEIKTKTDELSVVKNSEALLKDQLEVFQAIGTGDDRSASLQKSVIRYQTQVKLLEEKLSESNQSLNSLQADLSTVQSQYEEELQKRIELQNANEIVTIQNKELQEKLNSQDAFSTLSRKRSSFILADNGLPSEHSREAKILNHELEVVKQTYEDLQKEHQQLSQSHQESVRQLELSRQKFFAVEEALKEQELLMNNMEELVTEKESLQKELAEAHKKITQKQLSIEMLEKHVSIAKNRLAPLQKAAEDFEDVKDELEDLKLHSYDLEEKVEQLKTQVLEYKRLNQQLNETIQSPLGSDVFVV
jgi:chromosome segregation ATPase